MENTLWTELRNEDMEQAEFMQEVETFRKRNDLMVMLQIGQDEGMEFIATEGNMLEGIHLVTETNAVKIIADNFNVTLPETDLVRKVSAEKETGKMIVEYTWFYMSMAVVLTLMFPDGSVELKDTEEEL